MCTWGWWCCSSANLWAWGRIHKLLVLLKCDWPIWLEVALHATLAVCLANARCMLVWPLFRDSAFDPRGDLGGLYLGQTLMRQLHGLQLPGKLTNGCCKGEERKARWCIHAWTLQWLLGADRHCGGQTGCTQNILVLTSTFWAASYPGSFTGLVAKLPPH